MACTPAPPTQSELNVQRPIGAAVSAFEVEADKPIGQGPCGNLPCCKTRARKIACCVCLGMTLVIAIVLGTIGGLASKASKLDGKLVGLKLTAMCSATWRAEVDLRTDNPSPFGATLTDGRVVVTHVRTDGDTVLAVTTIPELKLPAGSGTTRLTGCSSVGT